MKRLLILVLVLASLIPISFADDISKSINVDFDFPKIPTMAGEVVINTTIQGQIYQYAINNETGSKSTTWTPNIKWNLSAGDCEEFTQNQNILTNFTTMAARMGTICDEVIKYTNQTVPYIEQLTLCAEEKGNCAGIMQERNTKITELETKTNLYDTCLSDKMSVQTNYNSCLTSKETLENKPDYSIWLGIGGVLAGWAIWGRKKQQSEFERRNTW